MLSCLCYGINFSFYTDQDWLAWLLQPNLKPPITSVSTALEYQKFLEEIDPSVTYLMTLYLSPDLTPDEIRKAAKAGIVGVKSYPRGVTTNSDSGIENYEMYYPVFEAMQEVDMVLNLHGEVPSDPTTVSIKLTIQSMAQ